MKLLEWLFGVVLHVFLFFSWCVGVWLQLYGDFWSGVTIVVLVLLVELVRELWGVRRVKKMGWLKIAGWCFGAFLSLFFLIFTAVIAVVFGSRTWHILLFNTALSTLVFLFGSAVMFWRSRK
ncbi:MAG: hypothetical protein QXF56_02450 [Candidatus Micrarchaeia archaeon]